MDGRFVLLVVADQRNLFMQFEYFVCYKDNSGELVVWTQKQTGKRGGHHVAAQTTNEWKDSHPFDRDQSQMAATTDRSGNGKTSLTNMDKPLHSLYKNTATVTSQSQSVGGYDWNCNRSC